MTEVFALTPPPPRARAKSLGVKPAWWLADVARNTKPHRERRAEALRIAANRRRDEALFVYESVREGLNDEAGIYPLAPYRSLPGGSPEILKILRHWDTEIKNSSRNEKRLLREPGYGETTKSWVKRVLDEAVRRFESTWHSARARGQLERFERVATCGKKDRGVLRCAHCGALKLGRDGKPIILKERCAAHLLCIVCREFRKAKYRAAFGRSRLQALRNVHRAGLGPRQARSDPVKERLLTLTCPHLGPDDSIEVTDDAGITRTIAGPEAQAYLVRTAWRSFMNTLRNHWRSHPGFEKKLIHFVRVIEATRGRDELGHVHIHVWLLSPFVRVHTFRALWGRALIRAGFPKNAWPEHAWEEKTEILAQLSEAGDERAYAWAKRVLPQKCAWPRVDIRETYVNGRTAEVDGTDESGRPCRRNIELELIKYLTKDLEPAKDGSVLMSPEIFASVYRGLDSGRMISASRGFWVKHHSECDECGALDSLRPCELPRAPCRPLADTARGPPLWSDVS